jgi:hypothetical protein
MANATDLVVMNGFPGAPEAKTFTLISPSAGDGGLATWALKEGTISTVFPRFTASARSVNGRARSAKFKVTLPASYTDYVTGLTSVNSRAEVVVTVNIPDEFPEALKNDLVAFSTGLLATDYVKSLIRDALSAT